MVIFQPVIRGTDMSGMRLPRENMDYFTTEQGVRVPRIGTELPDRGNPPRLIVRVLEDVLDYNLGRNGRGLPRSTNGDILPFTARLTLPAPPDSKYREFTVIGRTDQWVGRDERGRDMYASYPVGPEARDLLGNSEAIRFASSGTYLAVRGRQKDNPHGPETTILSYSDHPSLPDSYDLHSAGTGSMDRSEILGELLGSDGHLTDALYDQARSIQGGRILSAAQHLATALGSPEQFA